MTVTPWKRDEDAVFVERQRAADPLAGGDDLHVGNAQLVNYGLRGRFYVVDRLFDTAELRLGTKHQDVVRISRVAAQLDRTAS